MHTCIINTSPKQKWIIQYINPLWKKSKQTILKYIYFKNLGIIISNSIYLPTQNPNTVTLRISSFHGCYMVIFFFQIIMIFYSSWTPFWLLYFLTIHMIMIIHHSPSHFLIKYLLLLNPVQLRFSLQVQQLAVFFIIPFIQMVIICEELSNYSSNVKMLVY